MTIDEAITRAREVSDKYSNCWIKCRNRLCKDCMQEHEQLAEWLEELKEYRETLFDELIEAKKHCGEDSNCLECIFGQDKDICHLQELQITKMKNKVFIIGSTKHMDAIYHVVDKYKKKGFEVEYVFPQSDKPLVNLIHETFEKIEKTNIVVAVKKPKEFWLNNEMYGEGTLYEIEFAEKIGKLVIQENPYISCRDCTRFGDLHSSCIRVRNGEVNEDDMACSDIVIRHYYR